MVNFLGWFGSFLFSWCGCPQAIYSIKSGHSDGISPSFLFMWGLGEIATMAYVLLKYNYDWPLLTNYALNLLWIVIISKYKIWPRRTYVSK